MYILIHTHSARINGKARESVLQFYFSAAVCGILFIIIIVHIHMFVWMSCDCFNVYLSTLTLVCPFVWLVCVAFRNCVYFVHTLRQGYQHFDLIPALQPVEYWPFVVHKKIENKGTRIGFQYKLATRRNGYAAIRIRYHLLGSHAATLSRVSWFWKSLGREQDQKPKQKRDQQQRKGLPWPGSCRRLLHYA